ncbi:hypothetical protein [Longimicrobium sp.]|jgi:hypothetical protein|uniref:hypothetical protein n=1 Tax=Longimicrobium sp. TaxID=2029185 RepID=UPI002EDA2ABE
MHQYPLFRRVTASLLAFALLASCSAPEGDTKAGADASAAKVAAPEAQAQGGGGRFAKAIQNLATTKIVTCNGNGFFPQDSVVFVVDSTISTNDTTFNVPGGHALYLPMNAVSAGTQFVVKQAMPDTAAVNVRTIPEPVAYDTLVSLTVNYAMCNFGADTSKTLFRDSASHLSPVGNANRNKKVTAWLEHFSIYIVGGN